MTSRPVQLLRIRCIARPISIVIHNGRLWSAPGPATALAVSGDRILATGTDAEMLAMSGPATRMIDARGGLVTPGFEDSHVHFLQGARGLANLELSSETTVDGVLGKIREFAAAYPERDWLTGRGWFYAVFPGGMPNLALLDSVVSDRPVAIEAFDSHTTWVNSRALERLGISESTADPARGEIVRDLGGRPDGILKEAAMELVNRALPSPSRADDLDSLSKAIRLAHSQGITAVQEAGAGIEQFELYDALEATGGRTVRIRLGQLMEPGLSMDEWRRRLAEWEPIASAHRSNPWVSGGILKAFSDGVIESETALLLEPYESRRKDEPGARGRPQWEPGELEEAVRIADSDGWQLQIHAVGDAGVRLALDAYQAAASGNAPRERRHRIEHIETINGTDIPRFGELGVIASMQPYHADPEPAQRNLWTSKIGAERASRAWAWGSIQRAGGRLAFGSDWPIVSFDPRLGLNAAVNRTTPDGRPPGGSLPQERLSLSQALAGYTSGAAYAAWQEHERGRLEAGMLADIVVLETDLFGAPEEIMKTTVAGTIVGGRLVYERNSLTSD